MGEAASASRREVVRSDITVVGGGLAGVAAAVAAARLGASVALVQNRPVLGGNASSEVRVWVCGATSHGAQKFARETGIMGELFLENQYRNPEGNPVLWDQVVHDLVRAEPNVRLVLNTDVREVEADGPEGDRVIRAVSGHQQGTETLYRFESDLVIDASGDGLVGALAGARFRQGREARAEFGEAWAPEVPDDDMLGSTILFYVKDTGAPVRFVPPSITRDIAATSILSQRKIAASDNGCDYWWIEWGGELDTVADNEAIRDELWAVVYGIWNHLKNSGEFDAETLTLEWVGTVPGKREYRRFVGDHTLVQQEILEQTPFEDAVAFGGWSIDLHPPGGMYATEPGSKHLFTSGPYHVPWRSLYSVNVGNMLMAGRDISASHVAFGTTRVMATCAALGEAAGTGAALAVRHGIGPRELGRSHLAELRRTLLEQDAPVLGAPWDDPRDAALADGVVATASSTLTRIASGERLEALREFPLDDLDLGVLVPADPALEEVELGLSAAHDLEVELSLWTTERGENHIPVRHLETQSVRVSAGRGWVRAAFAHRSTAPEDLVVVLTRGPGLAVLVDDRPGPYGVLGLVSRTPRSLAPESERFPPTNAWSAAELRRRSVAVRVGPGTAAYAPSQVLGGHARPFGGPRLWSSERVRAGGEEWLEISFPRSERLARIDLVFNDDVDEDIVNLHHHTTPFEVIPELVRDYRLEALVAGEWHVVADERGNRRRLRRHPVPEGLEVAALRLVVQATNGAERVMVHGIRAFRSV